MRIRNRCSLRRISKRPKHIDTIIASRIVVLLSEQKTEAKKKPTYESHSNNNGRKTSSGGGGGGEIIIITGRRLSETKNCETRNRIRQNFTNRRPVIYRRKKGEKKRVIFVVLPYY